MATNFKSGLILAALPGLALVLACSSCTTTKKFTTTDSNVQLVLPTSRFKMATDEKKPVFFFPKPISMSEPGFPQVDVSKDSTVTVCVDVIISADGQVEKVTPIDEVLRVDGVPCLAVGNPAATPYLEEIHRSTGEWQFYGAALCHWKLDKSECEVDDPPAEMIERVRTRLPYRFDFTVENGVKRVKRFGGK